MGPVACLGGLPDLIFSAHHHFSCSPALVLCHRSTRFVPSQLKHAHLLSSPVYFGEVLNVRTSSSLGFTLHVHCPIYCVMNSALVAFLLVWKESWGSFRSSKPTA